MTSFTFNLFGKDLIFSGSTVSHGKTNEKRDKDNYISSNGPERRSWHTDSAKLMIKRLLTQVFGSKLFITWGSYRVWKIWKMDYLWKKSGKT